MEKRAYNFKDITGQKFGRLLVLCYDHYRNEQTYWKCQCDCGHIKIIMKGSLTCGDTKSCGCLHLELMQLDKGESNWNRLYYDYKYNAKKRNKEFSLNREEFKKICEQNCHYCNAPPALTNRIKFKKTAAPEAKVRALILANGIDRYDNTKDYTLQNSVACCSTCNFMKGRLHGDVYIDLCKKVAYNFKDKELNYEV